LPLIPPEYPFIEYLQMNRRLEEVLEVIDVVQEWMFYSGDKSENT